MNLDDTFSYRRSFVPWVRKKTVCLFRKISDPVFTAHPRFKNDIGNVYLEWLSQALSWNPEILRSSSLPPEIIAEAICQNYWAALRTPPDILTHEVRCLVVRQRGSLLWYIEHSLQTPEIVAEALAQDSSAIEFASPNCLTTEVCLHVVRRNGELLRYIEHSLQTSEIIIEALAQDPEALRYASPALLTPEIRLLANGHDGSPLQSKEEIQSFYSGIVKLNPSALKNIPFKDQTPAIISAAVKNNPNALHYVNPAMREGVWNEAIQSLQNSKRMKDIHDSYCRWKQDPNFASPTPPGKHWSFAQAIQKNPWFLQYLPPDLQTPSLVIEVISQDPSALRAVHQELLTRTFKTLPVGTHFFNNTREVARGKVDVAAAESWHIKLQKHAQSGVFFKKSIEPDLWGGICSAMTLTFLDLYRKHIVCNTEEEFVALRQACSMFHSYGNSHILNLQAALNTIELQRPPPKDPLFAKAQSLANIYDFSLETHSAPIDLRTTRPSDLDQIIQKLPPGSYFIRMVHPNDLSDKLESYGHSIAYIHNKKGPSLFYEPNQGAFYLGGQGNTTEWVKNALMVLNATWTIPIVRFYRVDQKLAKT